MPKEESSDRTARDKVALVCNIAALVVIVVLWVYGNWIASMGAPSRITALDRAGVMNEARLSEAFPSLADNPRRDVGMWVAEKERNSASALAVAGVAIAFVNLGLILASRRRSA
jgi:hypothetical protein